MPKFRKKPVVIEAVQFINSADIHEFCCDCAREPVGEDYIEIVTLEGVMKANQGDYIIKGIKGEFYPCKPDIFEATYDPVFEAGIITIPEDAGKLDKITFGLAIEALKKGFKVARKGWNGKGMFLYFVPPGNYPARMGAIKGVYDDDIVPYGAYIAMKTAQGNVVPWLASQTDMLSEDWQIVE